MLPQPPRMAITSTTTFKGINHALEAPVNERKQRLAQIHRSTNGKMMLSEKSLVAFPCNIRYVAPCLYSVRKY